jgi:hypothetical protein
MKNHGPSKSISLKASGERSRNLGTSQDRLNFLPKLSPGTCQKWAKHLARQPHNDVHHGGHLTMSTTVDTYLKVNQGRVGDQMSVALIDTP